MLVVASDQHLPQVSLAVKFDTWVYNFGVGYQL